jgi:hypothetical protein
MQKIAVITKPSVVRAILASVGLNTGPPQKAVMPRQTQISLAI